MLELSVSELLPALTSLSPVHTRFFVFSDIETCTYVSSGERLVGHVGQAAGRLHAGLPL